MNQKFRENFRVIFFYYRKYWRYYSIGILSLIIVDGLEVFPPLLLRNVVDGLEKLRDPLVLRTLIFNMAAAYLAISLVQSGMRFLWRKYIVRTSMLGSNDMRQELFAHLSIMAPGFFKKRRVGDLVSLATNDIEATRFALGPGTLTFFDCLFYFLVIPPTMFFISPKLTIVSFIPLIGVPFFVRRMEDRIVRSFKQVQDRFSDLAAHCQESLGGIRVIKSAALEPFKEREMEELGSKYIEANLESAITQSTFSGMLDFFVSTSTTILFLLGGAYVLKERISIGVFVAFQRYIQKMAWPMEGFGLAANIFQRSFASQKRVDAVMLEKAGILPPSNKVEVFERKVPLIEVKNLSFTYPGKDTPALNNISFTIKPGRKLGLAGNVGSGKSTLLACLARMEPVPAGTIFFDGQDVTTLPVEYVRRKIGIVPQEIFLFSRTVADNILYGSDLFESKEKAQRIAAAIHAAETAHVAKEIERIQDGYEAMLGERGVNLSGGQKQRISIARALARNPEILLLDDCLSAVDAETERKLIGSLQGFADNLSLVIASHRLSAFDQLDWALVMEQGKILEQGRPLELKSRGNDFAKLYTNAERDRALREMELVK